MEKFRLLIREIANFRETILWIMAEPRSLGLALLPRCSYDVAEHQAHGLLLTCSYTRATVWRTVRSKKKGTPKAVKGEVIRFRASAEQKQALEEAASRNGLELSTWLRQLALRAAGVLK